MSPRASIQSTSSGNSSSRSRLDTTGFDLPTRFATSPSESSNSSTREAYARASSTGESCSRATFSTSPRRSESRSPTSRTTAGSVAIPADRAIVPVQAEYYALEGLSQLLGTINLVKAQLNPQLAVAGILLTMADGRTRLAGEVEAELRRHFGSLVFTTTIPRSVRLAEAPSHGVPAIAYDRRSAGAEAYWKVAMELVERS